MLENQLVILKAGKYGKESSIYPASPRETVFQGNQVVDYWKFPDIQAFELATAKGNTELEYHHLATPIEIMILGNKYQWFLKSHKEKQLDIHDSQWKYKYHLKHSL